jgi:hypothetical protein
LENLLDVALEERQMNKSEQMSEATARLSAIEKAGIEAALDRCRALAHQIRGDLRNKSPEHLVSIWSLADFQVSLERAASVLEQKSRRSLQKNGGIGRGRANGDQALFRSASRSRKAATAVRTSRVRV